MLKNLVALYCLLLVAQTGWSQEQASSSGSHGTSNVSVFYLNGVAGVGFNKNQDTRYDVYSYNPMVFQGNQVVSTHQRHLGQDRIYFIDENGNTEYATYGINNSAVNLSGFRAVQDSFNPYGSTDPWEGLATGLLNGLINGTLIQQYGAKK